MSKSKELEVPAVAEATKELETRPTSELSAMDQMYQEDAGRGMEGIGAGDFSVPFLAILQKGSPQVSRANAKYIKDSQVGMIFNTVTQDVYDGDEGIQYIPCGFQKSLVRWKSRDSGGGLVCSYKEGDPALKKFKRDERSRLIDPETDDVIIDTAYHFGAMLHGAGFPEMAVISMASTQLKASRNWNTIMRRIMKRGPGGEVFNPPTYSHIYRIKTIPQTKDTFDWFGFSIIPEGEVKDVEIYKLCREFSRQIAAGNVRVSAPPQDFDEAGGEDSVPF